MEKLKIAALTEHLSEIDKKNILHYLKSPFLVHKKDYYLLFDSLLAFKNNCTKSVLWDSIYPKQKLDEQRFRKLCYETLQEIEQCLSIHHLLQNKETAQQHLLGFYLEYEFKDFFETKIENTRKINSAFRKYGSDIYLHQYQLEHLYFLYTKTGKRSINVKHCC